MKSDCVYKVLVTYANREGSGEPMHRHSLARGLDVLSYNIGHKRKFHAISHVSGPTGWLSMRGLIITNYTSLSEPVLVDYMHSIFFFFIPSGSCDYFNGIIVWVEMS